jgi:hypothetical protein
LPLIAYAVADFLTFVGDRETVAFDCKDFDRIGNVLEVLRTKVAVTEHELLLHLIVNLSRNANAAGFRDAFKTGRNVHAIAVDIVALHNHVAKMHANAKYHRPLVGRPSIARGHLALNLSRAINRLDHAGKFCE